MAAIIEKRCFSPQEYLERERTAEFRSEYDHGVIIPMPGASEEHNTITFNLSGLLWSQRKPGVYRVFPQDMRVRIPAFDKYYYPDIVIVRGEAKFETTAGVDVLLNPTLIIEVLSSSTEQKDRHEKFDGYETLDSLTDYVLISQNEPRIEHFSREGDQGWRFVVVRGQEGVLHLPTVGCRLPLADVYTDVAFPPPTVEADTEEA